MKSTSQVLDPQIRNPEVAFEGRDLSHRAVFSFFVSLAVLISIVLIVMWGVFRQLGSPAFAGYQTTNPIMTSNDELKTIGGDPANSFPAPHLQPDPSADLNKFRIREEVRLNTYGWVDQQQGRIHIPIEKAIDIMAASWPQQQEQGTAAPQAPSRPTVKSASGATQAPQAITDDRGGNYGR